MRRWFAPLLRIAVLLLVTAAEAAPWPAVDSDLPAHPDLRTGTLANGLRYAVLPNAEPRGRISLRLVVAAGALHEGDDELGLAHFVEHMVFRGTRAHPAGSLIAALQRLGVDIGPDTGAFTHLDHTVYHLELPQADAATLRSGLQALREFAAEATFEPADIEKERGVILSEIATRDTPAQRGSLANLQFLWPDSRAARRPVGGEPGSVRRFTRETFVGFYDAWYRPERMALVIVGNVEPAAAIAAVEQNLGGLRGRGEPRPEPADLWPAAARAPDIGVHTDAGSLGLVLGLQRPRRLPLGRETQADRVSQLHEGLAFAMFQQRLVRMVQEAGTRFLAPAAAISPAFGRWQIVGVSVSARIDEWKLAAAELEQAHRRAVQFGFTAAELADARTQVAAAQAQAVRGVATWPSDWLATQLAAALVHGRVFAHPADLQRDLAEPLARTTPEDCLRAFRAAWSDQPPHVFAHANTAFAVSRADIAAVLNASRRQPVDARDELGPVPPFAYEDFGPAGRLEHDEHLADLDVRLARFANGVRLNFKRTEFEADTVDVHVRVGEGKLTQPADRPGLDFLANAVLPAGGLGRHSARELNTVLAGRPLAVSFAVAPDACVFSVRTARAELTRALQVVAAYLTDAAYRPEVMRETRAGFHSFYANLAAAPSGPISQRVWRDLAGGDRRFGLPAYDELFSRTLDEVKAWIGPQLQRGALELSVVGDVGWDEARDAVARTLGALPAREPRKRTTDLGVLPPAPPREAWILPLAPGHQLCTIAWYWPAPAFTEIRTERRRRLLARILDERCRVRIREELGAAYRTQVTYETTDGFPHLNAFTVFTEVAPAHAAKAMEIIHREASSLAQRGVTADEFERMRPAFLRARQDDLRTNAYWGRTVLSDAQQNPARLAAARDRATDTAAITAAELTAIAREVLPSLRAFRYATVPQTAPAAPAAPAASAAAPTAR